jgi:hypothetical protein
MQTFHRLCFDSSCQQGWGTHLFHYIYGNAAPVMTLVNDHRSLQQCETRTLREDAS